MNRRLRLDQHLDALDELVEEDPFAVVILMHNLFRNLYPVDPYIPFSPGQSPLERLDLVLETGKRLCSDLRELGSYPRQSVAKTVSPLDVRDATGEVYTPLWSRYDAQSFLTEGRGILHDRLTGLPVSLSEFAHGSAIDVGCGSGRFTNALAELGFSPVVGVDWNESGFLAAQRSAGLASSLETSFIKGNLLDLPVPDESYDFVFSNGTAHHTGDTQKALAEVVRVMKPGGYAWLYLYGAGGHFWHARRRMPQIMKRIPQDYTMQVLDLLGMPETRFIFTDNWYVPIEDHTTDAEARTTLGLLGIEEIWRVPGSRATDLPQPVSDVFEEMYGDGELRYLIRKPYR